MKSQRKTRQRKAIRAAIESAGRPLNAHEILDCAGRDLPDLGIATVYRCLKRLESEDFICRVEIAGQAARYELAGLHHHHHFFCDDCSRVFDVPGCGLAALNAPEGFAVREHEVVLRGLCSECAPATAL